VHGSGDIDGELEKRLNEMAKVRGIELDHVKYRIETLDVPEG
jgi:hypothetical protein